MSRRPPAVREWLPRLAPRLSLAIPEPVMRRHAADGYPFAWAIHRRIDDAPYDGVIDTAAAMAAWGRAARRFWIHDDLLRPNVLVRNGPDRRDRLWRHRRWRPGRGRGRAVGVVAHTRRTIEQVLSAS